MIRVNEKFRNIFTLLIIYYRSYIIMFQTSSEGIEMEIKISFLPSYVAQKWTLATAITIYRQFAWGEQLASVGVNALAAITQSRSRKSSEGWRIERERERKLRHIGCHHREPGAGMSLRLPSRDRVMIRTLSTRSSLLTSQESSLPHVAELESKRQAKKVLGETREACWKMYKQWRNSWSKEQSSRRKGTRSGSGFLRLEANNNIRGPQQEHNH